MFTDSSSGKLSSESQLQSLVLHLTNQVIYNQRMLQYTRFVNYAQYRMQATKSSLRGCTFKNFKEYHACTKHYYKQLHTCVYIITPPPHTHTIYWYQAEQRYSLVGCIIIHITMHMTKSKGIEPLCSYKPYALQYHVQMEHDVIQTSPVAIRKWV